MEPRTSKKPCKAFNHRLTTADGHTLDVHQDGRVAGAFLELPGKDRSLSVVSADSGSQAMNYVGYRDGRCQSDTLAISVAADGSVTLQVVMPGEGNESARVRELSLDQVHELVAGMMPPPA